MLRRRHGELAAAGGDVDAAPLAHRAGEIELAGKEGLKAPRRFQVGGRAVVSLSWIQRNEIYLRRPAAQQIGRASCRERV